MEKLNCSDITLFGCGLIDSCEVTPKEHSIIMVSKDVYRDMENGQSINDMGYLKRKIKSGEIYPHIQRIKMELRTMRPIPIKGTNQIVYI